MNTLLSIAIGIGLAAACGFRVFVPLLVLSLAALSRHVHRASGAGWIGTGPAAVACGAATTAEVAAYYDPAVDHLFDMIATPAAVVAGTVAAAAVVADLPPLVRWGTALIAGGGAAGMVQGTTVLARLKSTAFTGGLGNPLVASGEFAGSVVTSLLALFVPLLCLILLVVLGYVLVRRAGRFAFGRRRAGTSSGANA